MDLQRAAGSLQLLHAVDEMGGLIVGIERRLVLSVLDDVGGNPVLGISSAIGNAAGFLTAGRHQFGRGLLQITATTLPT